MSNSEQNIIQTALNAARNPSIVVAPDGQPLLLTPAENGAWESQKLARDQPERKRGTFQLHDVNSVIKFVEKHRQDGTEIYLNADFTKGNIEVIAVLNGHTAQAAGFGDFRANYKPQHTPSAAAWLQNNGERMNQSQFAAFLTNHARDIVSQNPDNPNAKLPSAAEVLDFALNLEYTEKTTFKQGYREQDGRINFTITSADAGNNEQNLNMYEKFGIAFTPYQGGDSFFVEALLRFRIDKNNGALVLWYEMQQVAAVMENAAQAIADKLQAAFADLPIYYGIPN